MGRPIQRASSPDTCALYSSVSRSMLAPRLAFKCSSSANLPVKVTLSWSTPCSDASLFRWTSASLGKRSNHSLDPGVRCMIVAHRWNVVGPSFWRCCACEEGANASNSTNLTFCLRGPSTSMPWPPSSHTMRDALQPRETSFLRSLSLDGAAWPGADGWKHTLKFAKRRPLWWWGAPRTAASSSV